MRRRKTTRSVANSGLAETADHPARQNQDTTDHKEQSQSPARRIARAFFVGFCTFLSVKLFLEKIASGNNPGHRDGDGSTSTSFSINDLSNSLSTSTDMIKLSFDEFYSANVQPLLDMGMRNLNGTTHEIEENTRIGYQLRMQNAHAKYPIIMIPGFVTSGLELWEGTTCAKKHFRQRLWGSVSMAKTFLADRHCWREHLALHPMTGMDPPRIRVRSAQGFEAADNFIATYWVWSKIIENLADVGYDGSSMTMMSYDWRLGYEYLEKRDGYFTKLKLAIEGHHITSGEKVVLISHSMGGTVTYYFLQWVIADVKVGGGGGGKNWVEKHIHAFINIAGTLLGAPKSIPALLSGELKDTAMFSELLEQYFGRRWRRNLWTTWGSLFGLLPKGGDAIWGVGADLSGVNADDDGTVTVGTSAGVKMSFAPTIVWHNGTDEICPSSTIKNSTNPATDDAQGFILSNLKINPSRTWSMQQTVEYLLQTGGASSSIYASDAKSGWKKRISSIDARKHWNDPVATKLPNAPSMKIYCLYGTGIETERAYYYKVSCNKLDVASATTCDNNNKNQCGNSSNTDNNMMMKVEENDEPPEAPFILDTTANDESMAVRLGVQHSDGDASVPLISLGYMCQKWSQPNNPHNPSGIHVYTRERKHEAQATLSDPGRGGPTSGEHVDILGNVGVIEDVVRIATGFEVKEKVNEDIIVSDLKSIVRTIDAHVLGGSNSVTK
jgi:phospholipid:diacylglycerol acyltransferase